MKEISLNEAIGILSEKKSVLYDALISDLDLPLIFLKNCKAWMGFDSMFIRYPCFSKSGIGVCFAIVPFRGIDGRLNQITEFAKRMIKDPTTVYYYFTDSAPENFVTGRGVVYHEAIGVEFDSPSNIRFLTKNDMVSVEDLFVRSKSDPSAFSDIIACLKNDMEYFLQDQNEERRFFLGWFDSDVLIGAISLLNKQASVFISNLYVSPIYRRRGIGRSLLKSALSVYPGKRYVYSHLWENEISRLTVQACGFTLSGECVWGIRNT